MSTRFLRVVAIAALSALLFALPTRFQPLLEAAVPPAEMTNLLAIEPSWEPALESGNHQTPDRGGLSTSAKFVAWFSLDQMTTQIGSVATARINLSSGQDVSSFEVRLTGSGDLSILSDQRLSLPGAAARTTVGAPVSYSVTRESGTGRLRAVVTALDASGKALDKIAAELDVLIAEDEVLHSNVGLDAIRMKSLDQRLKAGKIDKEQHRREWNALWRKAPKPVSVTTASPMTVTTPTNVTMSGTLSWTDGYGVTHPLPFVTVEVLDDDGIGDDLITTTTTDENGHFTASFPNDTSILEGGYDLYVKIWSKGEGAWVEEPSMT